MTRLYAAAGAALITLSFPRGGCWPLGWFCLVPLFFRLNSDSRPGLTGLLAGWAFNAGAFFWIFGTCRYAGFSLAMSALALAGLAFAMSYNWLIAGWLGKRMTATAPRALRPWLWAAAFTAVTSASERWTVRVPGDMLAYTQWPNLSLVQSCAWGGPHLLGFVVFLVNASIAEAWEEASTPAAANLAACAALVLGLWIHGEWTLLNRPASPGATARVELLQPNVDQYRKWDLAYSQEILDNFDDLLKLPSTAPPALVVWPETAIPRQVPGKVPVAEALVWARKQSAAHLVGIAATTDGRVANAAQLVSAAGSVAGYYAKRTLVPFGEYVPFRNFVPQWVVERWLKDLDNWGDMAAGEKDQPLLQTAFGPTAVTICYEATFPRRARLDALSGARLLVNLTNDGWYKDTWGPSQHFGMNVFRAVENRITVVRCANSGVSGVIDPWGVVTASLPLGTRGRLDADVPLEDSFPDRSFYTRHGDWIGNACLLITALAFVFALGRRNGRMIS